MKRDELLLGIDLGTSGVKTGVYGTDGELVCLARTRAEFVQSPRPGWSQSDPSLWWKAIVSSIGRAVDGDSVDPERIRGIGISVFIPVVIPLDGEGDPLYPAILYSDQRSVDTIGRILTRLDGEEYERTIGNVLAPGTCAVSSMSWLREEEEEVYDKTATLGFANTYIAGKLTGRMCADPGSASVSGLADIRKPGSWSSSLCEMLGIDMNLLPDLVKAHEVIGAVTPEAARETGLRKGTPVVVGTGDVICASFGAGAVDEPDIVYIAGSSDCVTAPSAAPLEGLVWVNSAYVEDGRWLGIGTSTTTGACVDWFIDTFLAGGPAGGGDPYDRMIDLAASCPAGAGGVLFLPYLLGERTPIWDPEARGMFIGLTISTGLAEMARAVFEGTGYAFRDIIKSFKDTTGRSVERVLAVGGGTKNHLWNRIKADILQKPLDIFDFQETGSLGAAMLAGIGTGIYGSCREAAEETRAVVRSRRVAPEEDEKSPYDSRFALYRGAYTSGKSIMHSLSRDGA
jgi:xylulokinase